MGGRDFSGDLRLPHVAVYRKQAPAVAVQVHRAESVLHVNAFRGLRVDVEGIGLGHPLVEEEGTPYLGQAVHDRYGPWAGGRIPFRGKSGSLCRDRVPPE